MEPLLSLRLGAENFLSILFLGVVAGFIGEAGDASASPDWVGDALFGDGGESDIVTVFTSLKDPERLLERFSALRLTPKVGFFESPGVFCSVSALSYWVAHLLHFLKSTNPNMGNPRVHW